MIGKRFYAVAGSIVLLISGAEAQISGSPAVRPKPRPSGQQIAAIENPNPVSSLELSRKVQADRTRLQAGHLAERRGAVDPVQHQEPSQNAKPTSGTLLQRSVVLSDGKYWTIVPRGAVLNVPDRFKERVGGANVGNLLTWSRFYQRNRGWLYAQPVEMAQARGEQPITQAQRNAYAGTGRVVVAVFRQGPISVHEAAMQLPALGAAGLAKAQK